MMLENHVFRPSQLIPPGETISEILDERKITTGDFAQGIGVPYEIANKLLIGDFVINKELAAVLSGVLGASPTFWLNREENYRAQLSELKTPLTREEDSWLKEIPVSTMQKTDGYQKQPILHKTYRIV